MQVTLAVEHPDGAFDDAEQAFAARGLVIGHGPVGQAFQQEPAQVTAGLETGVGAGLHHRPEAVAGQLSAVELASGACQPRIQHRVGPRRSLKLGEGPKRQRLQHRPIDVDGMFGGIDPRERRP